MVFENYDYDKENYPSFTDGDIDRYRYDIVKDSYWNAKNLKSIIDEVYDTSRVYRMFNRKEEMIFSLVALACELYLKSLVYSDCNQRIVVKQHDLYSLYELLPQHLKTKIIDLTKESESDFAKKLDENKNVFIRFRYSYEMKGYRINATFLLEFMNALSVLCDVYYPKSIVDGVEGFYKCGMATQGVSYRVEIE